ncbi:MerC domain-containing protein [Novosphingobium sp.]|uniref:MerC domain-containing protein n=1 Tax=Novosphingobium sp. TaxID=1874826 RepID=UPI003B5211F5
MPDSFQTPAPHNRRLLDRFGIVLSGLCMVHCMAGLVLIGVLGLGGGLLLDPAIHRVGLVLAVTIGAVTIGANALRHGHRLPLALGCCGLAMMAVAIASDHGMREAVLTIGGVALLASAHVVNLRRAPVCC